MNPIPPITTGPRGSGVHQMWGGRRVAPCGQTGHTFARRVAVAQTPSGLPAQQEGRERTTSDKKIYLS